MTKYKEYTNLVFITISRVTPVYGISRATVYRWIETGKLPQPTRITPKIVGWNRALLDKIFLGEDAK